MSVKKSGISLIFALKHIITYSIYFRVIELHSNHEGSLKNTATVVGAKIKAMQLLKGEKLRLNYKKCCRKSFKSHVSIISGLNESLICNYNISINLLALKVSKFRLTGQK